MDVTLCRSAVCGLSVEYKGHRLLDSAKQADVGHVKKQVSCDLVNFKHPVTGDTALVCFSYAMHVNELFYLSQCNIIICLTIAGLLFSFVFICLPVCLFVFLFFVFFRCVFTFLYLEYLCTIL